MYTRTQPQATERRPRRKAEANCLKRSGAYHPWSRDGLDPFFLEPVQG